MSECRSGWYQGHKPKEPNDDCRTVCIYCGKPLVKYGFTGRWKVDKTKKGLETLQSIGDVMQK